MNQYPAQQTAEQLARHGRYGDSVLVHMNPAEVQGIAALSPTGKLTRNPVTGQPEAFLPFLAPLLGSWLGSTLLGGTLGTALAGGIGSGLATAAVTGDLKRGLVSGIMGAGLGAAFGAAGQNAAEAAGSVAEGTATQAASDLAAEQAASQFAEGSVLANAGNAMQPGVITQGAPTAIDASLGMGSYSGMPGAIEPSMANMSATDRLLSPFQKGSGLMGELTKARTTIPFALGAGKMAEWDQLDAYGAAAEERKRKNEAKRQRALSNLQYGYSAAQPYGFAEGGSTDTEDVPPDANQDVNYGNTNVVEGTAGLPPLSDEQIAMLFNGNVSWEDMQNYLIGTGGKDPINIQRGLRGQYKKAPPADYRHGFNAEFDWFQNDPNVTEVPDYKKGAFGWSEPYYLNYASPINRFAYGTPDWWWPEPPGNRPYFDSMIGNNIGWEPPGSEPSSLDPRNAARANADNANSGGNGIFDNLVGSIDTVRDFMRSGGGAEPPVEAPTGPPEGGTGGGGGGAGGRPRPRRLNSVNQQYADMPLMDLIRRTGLVRMAVGGAAPMPTPLGEAPVSGGGVADVGRQIGIQQMQKPAPDEVHMLAAAIAGQLGGRGEQVIELFIQKYGVNMFRAIRQKVLQMIQPGAQTEGMVQGAGGGMDDQVMGMIGNQQPVAVSPGEYIVPADVVSGLGDGSSDAGAAELDQMSQRVRRARGGSIEQPPPLNARYFTPL